jgi:hypothetical protein
MAARRTFVAELNAGNGGRTIAMAEKFSWNSAVRASEGLVRDHARQLGTTFTGDLPTVYGGKPGSEGAEYRRTWHSPDGVHVWVRMAEVHS